MNYRNPLQCRRRCIRAKYIILPKPTKGQRNCFIALFLVLLLPIITFFSPIIFYNFSDSAPHGIYLRIPGEVTYGDYAAVRLPHTLYLGNGRIEPEGKILIKTVRGLPGDQFTVKQKEVSVSSSSYVAIFSPYTYPINDSPYLPHVPTGKYIIPEQTTLYLNAPEGSFDSRYLGPISDHYRIGRIILIIDFEYVSKIITCFIPTSTI